MVTGKETFQEYFGTWLTEDFWCKIVAKCFFKLYEMYEMKINFEFEKLLRPKTRKRLFWKLHILFGNSFEVLNDSLVRFYLNISFANLFFLRRIFQGVVRLDAITDISDLYFENIILLMSPSLRVSVGWPTQNVKKHPSQLTLRVQTPMGYHPTLLSTIPMR